MSRHSSLSLNDAELFLDWLPSFSSCCSGLDAQYLDLITLFQKADQCLSDDGLANFERLAQALEAMLSFAKAHFSYEETVLSENGAPALDEHRGEHAGFLQLLSDFIREVREGVVALEKLLRYLEDWWFRHLTCADTMIADTIIIRPRKLIKLEGTICQKYVLLGRLND